MLLYTVLILVMVPYLHAQECDSYKPGDEFKPREVSFQPGSKWILVKFKPPLCATKLQIDFYRFPVTDLNRNDTKLITSSRAIFPSCFESREDFLLYNVSRGSDPCGQNFDIKPCTVYDRLRIRAFYNDSQIQKRVIGYFDQSVTTLLDLEEILQQPTVKKGPDSFRVSWKHPSCKDYVSSWLVTIVDPNEEPPKQQIPFEIPVTTEMRGKNEIHLKVSSGTLEYPGGRSITNLQVVPSRQYAITIAPKYNTTEETGKGISVSVQTDKTVIGAFEITSVNETEVSFTVEVDNQNQWIKLTNIITKKYAWIETTLPNCPSARIYRYACTHTISGYLEKGYWGNERTYIYPCRSYKLSIGPKGDPTLAFYTPPGSLGQLTIGVEKATEDSVELNIGLHEGCSLKLAAVHLSLFQNGNPAAIVDTKVDESCQTSERNKYLLTLGNGARCDPLRKVSFQGCTKYYVILLPELQGRYNGTVSKVSIVTKPRGSSANVRNITFPLYPSSFELLQWNAPECTVSLHLTKYYVSLYRVHNETQSASASSAICSFQVGSREFTSSGPVVQIKLMEQCKRQFHSCSQYRVDIASSFEGLSHNYSESYSFTTPPSAEDCKVRGLAVTDVTQDSFKFYWENPLCGKPISFFRIAMNAGNNFIDVPSDYFVSFTAPLTISNEGIWHKQFNSSQWKPPKLMACLNYTVYVTPHYQVYGSGQSENVTFATKAAETQPLKVTVSDVAATSVVIQWNEDLNPQCILHYEVNILNDSPGSSEGLKIGGTTKETTFAVNGLILGTNYSITVYAYLTSGRRQGSELVLSFVTETAEAVSLEAIWIGVGIAMVATAVLAGVLFMYFRRRRKLLESSVPVSPSPIYETPVDVRYTTEGQLRNKQKPIRLSGLMKNRSKSLAPRIDQLQKEFQSLRLQKKLSTQDAASLPENKCRNRDVYILPFDFNRVLLSTDMVSGNTDYINASYIPGLYGSRDYIAAQAPTAATLADFWDMIWQQKVHVIVMLTAIKERGKVACEQYWPENNSTCHGTVTVRLRKVELSENFAVREMEIRKGEDHRLIIQLHYTTWPELGCPRSTEDFIVFLRTVNEKSTMRGLGFCPVLVHGSAGVGRTGTFIATDILVKEAVLSEQIDVIKTVSKLRAHRPDMVQTLEQYAFIYTCIDLYVRTVLRTSWRPT